MSQHDFNVANQGFPAFRGDMNNALAALASNSSGATAPSTTYAYQWWYDTTTNILKMRNADNDAWISFATFDQATDTWSVTSLKATTEIRTPAILDASGGTTATVNGIPLRPGVLDPENRIINGAFDFWQRGTSSTAFGYVAADRFSNSYTGGTVTQSRQSFALGDTLGSNNPKYFLRQTVSGQAAAGNYGFIGHRIEGVSSYAGQTITLLGWARRSSGSGNVAVETDQYFGGGGSPSANVRTYQGAITLTSSWAPFAVVCSVPSVSGKTLGTDGADSVGINFWTSAGSAYNARTNSLGLQTIGVDLWGIHIKQGTHTTSAVDLYRQPELGPELARCQRYYQKYTQPALRGVVSTTNIVARAAMQLPVALRGNPTVSAGAFGVYDGVNVSTVSSLGSSYGTSTVVEVDLTVSPANLVVGRAGVVYQSGAASLTLDAEL